MDHIGPRDREQPDPEVSMLSLWEKNFDPDGAEVPCSQSHSLAPCSQSKSHRFDPGTGRRISGTGNKIVYGRTLQKTTKNNSESVV